MDYINVEYIKYVNTIFRQMISIFQKKFLSLL